MRHAVVEGNVLVKYEREKDKLRIGGGSWTINLSELAGNEFDMCRYITESKIYTITRLHANMSGFVRVFKGEQKLVVPIKYWDVQKKGGTVCQEDDRKRKQ